MTLLVKSRTGFNKFLVAKTECTVTQFDISCNYASHPEKNEYLNIINLKHLFIIASQSGTHSFLLRPSNLILCSFVHNNLSSC